MQNHLTFTPALPADLVGILLIIEEARQFMKSQHSGQWQDGTPTKETIINDIAHRRFFVAKMGEEVVGCLALLNHEEGYDRLLTGQWVGHGPYKVIHRFATRRDYFGQGIAGYMLKQAEHIALSEHVKLLRVDTHQLNIPMTRLLLKHGYVMTGTTLIEKTKLRTTFEKLL